MSEIADRRESSDYRQITEDVVCEGRIEVANRLVGTNESVELYPKL